MTPDIVLDALILLHSTISTSPCHFQELYDKPLGMRLFMFTMKGSASLDGVPLSIVFFFQFVSSLVGSPRGNRLASHHSEPPVAAALAFGTLEIQPRTARLEDSQGQDTCLWEGTGYPYAGNHAFQRPTLPEILLHYIWDLCAWGPEACKAKMASHFDLFAANTQINCGTSMCIWLLMMYNYCYNSLPSSPPPPCYARGSWHGVACRTWNLAKSSRRTWTGHFLVRIVMNT